jgi:hypothetical protein
VFAHGRRSELCALPLSCQTASPAKIQGMPPDSGMWLEIALAVALAAAVARLVALSIRAKRRADRTALREKAELARDAAWKQAIREQAERKRDAAGEEAELRDAERNVAMERRERKEAEQQRDSFAAAVRALPGSTRDVAAVEKEIIRRTASRL